MSQPYYKRRDAQFNAWLTAFASQLPTYATELDLELPVIDAIAAASTNFQATLSNALEARIAAEVATAQKDNSRKNATDLVRPYIRQWQANPAIPDSVKKALDLPPTGTRGVPTVPRKPLDFTATPNVDGSVLFEWKRNGNNNRTAYNVERLVSNAWIPVTTTLTTRVTATGFQPGVSVTFRVVATRNRTKSDPSNIFTIYGAPVSLSISEADGDTSQEAA